MWANAMSLVKYITKRGGSVGNTFKVGAALPRGLSDMKSASEGGHGKVDIVREVA